MLVLVVVPGVHYFLTAEKHQQVHACDLTVHGILSSLSPASPSLLFDCRRQTCAIWWRTSGAARACWAPGRTSTTWSWCAGTSTPSGRHGTASSSPPTRPSRMTNSSAWMKWVEPPLCLFWGGKGGEIWAEWSLSCDCALSLYSASASSALLPLRVCLWPLAFPNQTNFPFRQVKGGITHGASNHVTITILGLT